MSEASAIHDPAPAVVPFRLAMTGFGSRRMLRISSQVRRVKSSKPSASRPCKLADDVAHVAAGTEGAAGAGDHHDANIFFITQRREHVG